jgi:superfamily II DNA/RNA helicase
MHLDDLSIVVFDEADTLLTRPIITEDTSTVIQLLKKQIRSKTIQRPVQHAFVSATVSKPLLDVLKREYPVRIGYLSSGHLLCG